MKSFAITYRSSPRSQFVLMPTSFDGSGGLRYWLAPDEIVPFQRPLTPSTARVSVALLVVAHVEMLAA